MSKKKTAVFLIVVAAVIAALVVGIVLTDGLYEKAGSVNETMQDAVLHEGDKISFFGMGDRKSTRLNSSHVRKSRMPSSA